MDEKTLARFWAKVDKRGSDECWEWTAGLNYSGYGMFSQKSGVRPTGAHRVSWELAAGRRIRRGLQVLHACDNKQCVNPGHLWLGTASDNRLDWFAKGCPPKTDKRHAKPRQPPTLEHRFWSKVNKSGPAHPYDPTAEPCWTWSFNRNRQGYGQFQYEGRSRCAHRVAFRLVNGRWPTPCGLHTCDNPPCCNPSHIIEGTLRDNVAQMMARGRQAKGPGVPRNQVGAKGDRNGMRRYPERNHFRYDKWLGERHARSKLTDALVHQIMALSATGITNQAIAVRVGVSDATVSKVRLGQIWKHVPRVPDGHRPLRIGEQHHGARITEAIARKILRLDAAGVRNCAIARQLRLSPQMISRVRLRQTWAHVTL